jgi:nitrate/nitrite transport system permease protein
VATGSSIVARAAVLSALLFVLLVGAWHLATRDVRPVASSVNLTAEQIEYLKLQGKDPAGAGGIKAGGFPTPAEMGRTAVHHLAEPFYDRGPNDKGIGLQLAYSLARVALGFLLAMAVAIPLGFVLGMSPLVYRALYPYINVLKPISPLAWMPLALYTIKDSSASGIFVIFICSLWPMLINTAFGVAGVRRDWLNVARTLEVSPLRKSLAVILPAAAPTIVTGMRISIGIAWLVIVAAEMLVGGTGIGYFIWNEWNNLSLSNVIFAILIIGVVGMALDWSFGRLQRRVAYVE